MLTDAKQPIQALRESVAVVSLALPDDDHFPTQSPQATVNALVSPHVLGEFATPERDARLRCVRKPTPRMAMPKAAVHKDDGPMASKDKIWAARKILSV